MGRLSWQVIRSSELHGLLSTYKEVIIPKPKMPDPMIGIIQCSLASADHPYQLQPIFRYPIYGSERI